MTWWVVLAAALAPNDGEPFRRWIEDLGGDRPELREEAGSSLRAAGRAAWPLLARAAEGHADPEVRARAADLLAASRLRRRLPFRLLDEHPAALDLLRAGALPDKVRLVRSLGRCFDECSDLLLELLREPEPEIALAAAEALNDNRNHDWIPRLLELLALEDCPRAGRVHDLLASSSSRIPAAELQRRFAATGPRGGNRFLLLALNSGLALEVPAPLLFAQLRLGDPPARRSALAWIRDRGIQGAVPDVERLLADPDPGLVAEALSTLRHLRHRPDPDRLEALLRHDQAGVRDEAALCVAAFGERSALPALRRLLLDPSTSVRQTALQTLWRVLGDRALDEVLEVYFRDAGETRDQAAALLQRSAAWALPRARRHLEGADPDLRQRAAELVARIEGPATLPAFARDPDESVRRWALAQLARAEFPAALDAVEVFARDGSDTVRLEALRVLVRRDRREHLPALEAFLASPEFSVRHEAAEAILERGGDRAAEIARTLLAGSEAPFRRLAFIALAERPDAASARAAFESLEDPDGRLRRAAHHHLMKALQARPDPALVARVADSLDRLDGEPLALAFRLVAEHGSADTAPALRRLLRAGRAPGVDRSVRALGEWAGAEALEELAGLLGADPALNETVFSRAREARRRLPAADARPFAEAVLRLLEDSDGRVRRGAAAAAEELGLAARLVERIDDPEPGVRHAAIGACVRAGLARAAPAIEARLDDEDPDVRVAAVAGLARLRPESVRDLARSAAQEDCTWARRRMEFALQGAGR